MHTVGVLWCLFCALWAGLVQVSVLGEVMEVKESTTSIVYMIDDRTGPWVKVQRWIEDQSAPIDPNERSTCREVSTSTMHTEMIPSTHYVMT